MKKPASPGPACYKNRGRGRNPAPGCRRLFFWRFTSLPVRPGTPVPFAEEGQVMRTRTFVHALASAAALACVVSAAPVPEQKKLTPEEVAKAEKAAKEQLSKLKGDAGTLQYIADEPLGRALPRWAFFSVLFRQYPVARLAPPGLKSSNVFAVGPDGTVLVLTDAAGLEKFFKSHLPPAKSDDQLKDGARAWLRLTQQFRQDGFYKFQLMDDSTKVSPAGAGKEVRGKVVAMAGGNGAIDATLTFDGAGKLARAVEGGQLRPGPRPICQATKLLDLDPLVRRMAEQDLRVMGKAAKDYLDEQRAKAAPELRRAIDRLWREIERAER
jgi:hypothetical protein